jgi:hypothetical protein
MPAEKERRRGVNRSGVVHGLLFSAGVFLYLYTNLFGISGIPIFRYGDENFFWEYASRMQSGQVFLRDFHQFTPPGTDLFYLTIFRFFGTGIMSTSWAVLSLGLALTLVCFLASRQFMNSKMAMASALTCLVLLYGDSFDATHHWFSMLLAMLAILLLSPARSPLRIVVAATAIALAAFCTQTTGAMTLLACCTAMVWERRLMKVSWDVILARIALLVLSSGVLWLLLSWRFIADAGLSHYWSAQVIYPQKYLHYPHEFLNPQLGHPGGIRSAIAFARRGIVYIVLIVVSPSVVYYCTRRRQLLSDKAMPLLILASFGTCEMLEVITRLTWNRMEAAAMPGVILGVWMVSRTGSAGKWGRPLCWWIMCGLILEQSISTQLYPYQRLALPGGNALLRADDAEEARWLVEHTQPGDWFFEVALMRFYIPLKLRDPAFIDTLLPLETTRPEWVKKTVDNLAQKNVQYLLWSPRMTLGHVQDSRISASDHLEPLRIYMREDYCLIRLFKSGDEIWEKRSPSVWCRT